MLIVDEAHHLGWSEHNPSLEYQLVEQLARQIPAVLLLTATPEQLGQESHFARLSLLDPIVSMIIKPLYKNSNSTNLLPMRCKVYWRINP